MKILDLDGVKKLIEKLKEVFVPRIKGTGSVVAYAENLSNFECLKISLPTTITSGSSCNIAFTIRMLVEDVHVDMKVSFSVDLSDSDPFYTNKKAIVNDSIFRTNYREIELGWSNDTKRLNLIISKGQGTTISKADVSIMNVLCGQNAIDMYNGWDIETCTIADYISSNTMDTAALLRLPDAGSATSASSASSAITATKLATARTLTIGNTGKTFDGSANVSWSLSDIGAAASSHTHTFASLTSKPTTLSGYGITDASTATSVDELYNLVYNILGQGCTMFVVVYASDTSALKINGSWVSIPAGKPTILKDVKTMEVNPDSAGTDQDPGRITKFDIHYNGKFQPTYWSTGNWGNVRYGMVNITALDVSGLDTSEMTNMSNMFSECRSLTSLDVSGFDTSKVNNMRNMFGYCSALTTLNLSNFDTRNVTRMDMMFYHGSSLTSLDLSNWDTSSVTNMSSMFTHSANLTNLIFGSKWDTRNVTRMDMMFYNCPALTSLDLSNWDTSSVTNMSSMFSYCYVLTNLILGSKWGTQTSTEANALTLDLSSCGSSKSYKLTDETYNSMLTMYDRKTAGLTEMTIKLSTKHNIPDGWTDKMVARGYTIVLS